MQAYPLSSDYHSRGEASFGRRPDPAYLDRLADAELQHGHCALAERLSHLASEMRESGR